MSDLPYPQISRLTTELYLSGVEAGQLVCGSKYVRSLIFLLLCRVCLEDWCGQTELQQPRTLTRFTSLNSIAASLGYPFETTRKNVHAMVDAGLLVRTVDGVALAAHGENSDRVIAYCTLMHDIFVRLIEDIATTCDVELPRPQGNDFGARDVLERALDINLVPFDTQHQISDNLTGMTLWLAISIANIRHITYDPLLTAAYAYISTPDTIRRPVALKAMARALVMPYATAWRHAAALEDANLLTRQDGNLVVLSANLHSAGVGPKVVKNVDYAFRRISELIRLGLDPARAGDYYLHERPPLMRI
jgi:hypothetical protein